jgi:dTDP-4-amino-4,6-dideoxygalactose transaminase
VSITVDETTFDLSRDELAIVLEAENIETRKYYDPPVHRQIAYREFSPPAGTLPNTELLSARSLSLPIWSHMKSSVVADICLAVRRAYNYAEEIKAQLKQKNGVAYAGR